MNMGRHCVPYASCHQACYAQHKLTALNAVCMNVFVQNPLIRRFLGAKMRRIRFFSCHFASFDFLVRKSRAEVQLRRIGLVNTGQYNLLLPLAYIKHIQLIQLVLLSVYGNRSRPSNVQKADLTTL
ncbi:hypothetical protein D3C79_934980 [compost metagenome]